MYDSPEYLNLKQACAFLGLGRNTVLKLCQERPNGFPAAKIGNRYQFDLDLLSAWRTDWYSGKFHI